MWSSASAGSFRPSAKPVAMPITEASWSPSTKRRSSGSPVRKGTSVEPGFANSVVSPYAAENVEGRVAHRAAHVARMVLEMI